MSRENEFDPKPMPRLYLRTPEQISDLDAYIAQISQICATSDVACLRLAGQAMDSQLLWSLANALKPICAKADVALLVEDNIDFAFSAKLDGVHLSQGAAEYDSARDVLGDTRIIGVGCEDSRHTGLIAAEKGADYVSFSPAEKVYDVVHWWQQMIETPCVIETVTDTNMATQFGAIADFLMPLSDSENVEAILAAAIAAHKAAE